MNSLSINEDTAYELAQPTQQQIFEEVHDELIDYLEALDKEGSDDRFWGDVTKATGLGAIGTGLFGCIALPGLGILAATLGLTAYGYKTWKEGTKTGSLYPVPFIDVTAFELKKNAGNIHPNAVEDGAAKDRINYHYLTSDQKADYVLLSMAAEDVAMYLSTFKTEKQRKVEWNNVRRRFYRTFCNSKTKMLDDPDSIIRNAEKGDVLRLLFAKPDDFRAMTKQAVERYQKQVDEVQQSLPPASTPAFAPEPLEDAWVDTVDITPASPAIVEQARPITVDFTPTPMAQPAEETAVVAENNFVDSWSDRVQNSLFVGKGGSGKGYLVSNVLRGVLKKRPDLKVLVIDPKASDKETGYWQSPEFGDRVQLYAKSILGMNCEDVYDWVEAGIARFNAMPAPKLLILDECTAVSGQIKACDKGAQKLIQFWTRINSWASLGDEAGFYTWLIAQNGHVGDFGSSGGVLGQFFRVAIVRGDDLAYAKTLQAGGLFNGLMPKDDRELGRLCQTSECNRAIYDATANKWRPMPVLTNHSAYDRDRRVSIASNAVVSIPVFESEPAIETTAVAVMERPDPTSNSLDFNLNDLMMDEEVSAPVVVKSTPGLDAIALQLKELGKQSDKALATTTFYLDLIQEFRAMGDGVTFTLRSMTSENKVVRRGADKGIIRNRSNETIIELLTLLSNKFKVVKQSGENEWAITLH